MRTVYKYFISNANRCTALLQVSRQIYSETFLLPFRLNLFSYEENGSDSGFNSCMCLDMIMPIQREAIEDVEMSLPLFYHLIRDTYYNSFNYESPLMAMKGLKRVVLAATMSEGKEDEATKFAKSLEQNILLTLGRSSVGVQLVFKAFHNTFIDEIHMWTTYKLQL